MECAQAKPQTKDVEESTLKSMSAMSQLMNRMRFRPKFPSNPVRLFVSESLSINKLVMTDTIISSQIDV